MSIISIRPKTPTGADVNAERDRRLHMQPFTVTGYNATIVVEGDAADRQNLLALVIHHDSQSLSASDREQAKSI